MKERKISYSIMDKMVEFNKVEPTTVCFNISEDEKVEVIVKQNISLEERIAFISTIRDIVFCADEDGVFDYRSCYDGLAFRFAILKYFTNLKMDDFNRTYYIYSNDKIFDNIFGAINDHTRDDIMRTYNNEIEYYKNRKLKTNVDQCYAIMYEAQKQNEQIQVLLNEFKDIDINDLVGIIGNMSQISDKERINHILDFQEKKAEMEND